MLSLLKHQFLDSISSSLTGGSRQSRIRYTCLDASEHYLVFGANTGSLYFYERETLNFVHLITTVQEPITQLKFSPNENYLAISTLKNFDIIILEPKLQTRKEKIVHRISDHKAEVTNMLWATLSPDNFRLYSSDESGVILATPIGAKAKGLFQAKIESDYLYKCDSRVVQLDFDAELNQLIASSLTRSILINFAKGSAVQVGKKLRDGTYGAVHYLMRQQTSVIGGDEGARDGADGMEEVPINQDQSATNGSSGNEGEKKKYLVLSRPGKRLWRADSENAKVLQTLNFQGSLTQAQLLPLFEDFLSEEKKAPPALNNINFSKLTPLGECLLSWTDKSLILIDVESVEIIQWHADAVGLLDLVVYNNEAYAIHADPIKISRIIFDVEAFVERLAKKGEWKRVIELVQKNQVLKVSWLEELSNLLAKSKTSTPECVIALKEVIENAKKFKPQSPEVPHKAVEEVPSIPAEPAEPERPATESVVTDTVITDDASSSAASEVQSEQSENLPQTTSQPIEVTAQPTTDESANGAVDQINLNISTSMPASQTEPIKISSPREANSLPGSLTKDTELPSSLSSVNSSPSPSPSSSSIQLPKEQVMSSSPDSTDSSDRMTSSVTSNEPLSDNPLVVHKTRSKKGRKSRMPVIAPLVTPVVFESSSEGNTPKSAPSTAFSSKDISPAVPKKDTTNVNPLSSSQPSTPAVPRADSSTGTKSSFNNFLSSILPNQPGDNKGPTQPGPAPTPNATTDKQPQQAKEKVQQVFTNFLDSIIPPAPPPQQTQLNNTPPNPTANGTSAPTTAQLPKDNDVKSTVPTAEFPAAAVFVPEKKEPEKKDKFNLQKFTDQLRDKVKEEILPEAAKGLDELKNFFKTGTMKKKEDRDKTVAEPAAPKAIEIEDARTRFVTEKVNALRRKPTNLVLPSKSTTLSTSIATSHVTRAEHQSDNDQRRAAVLTPLLKQWLKYFDHELRQLVDLTSNNDKLFLKQEEKEQENGTDNNTASTVPVSLAFVSKKSIELLLTECYRYKAFNDTTSVNELDLMDNFIENYWGLFNYNEVYLYTWQSKAQSVLAKLDRRGEEYFSQLLAAYEAKVAEQQVSDDLVLTSSIREAQLRKQIQSKIQSDTLGDALQQIENHKQWSLLLRNMETLLAKNTSATTQVLVNRSDELLPSLVLDNIGEKNKSQYLKKLLKERKIHRRDAALVHALLTELIVEDPPSRGQLFDDNNKLSPDALKVEWSNTYSLTKILGHSNKYQFDTKAVEDLTREHGFIKGLKLMLLHNKKHEDLISLIVELDDLDEFETVLVKNPVTSTPANWTHLIRAVLKTSSDDQTSDQARRLNLLFTAHRAIAALGPRTAVKVLQTSLKDQQVQLPASFFSAVLAETRAEVCAKLPIVRESLEVLDSHLWAVRSAALGAPFAEVFNHEVDAQVNDLNVDLPFVAIGANGQDELNFEYVEHSPAYFEEANVHWGVSTNLTTHKCAQCLLPMSESNGTKIFISHPSQHHASVPVHEKCYSLTH